MGTYAKIKLLSVREKLTLLAGALCLLAIVAYWGVLAPAKKQAETLRRSAATLQKDIFEMRMMLVEIGRLRKPEMFFKSKSRGEIGRYISESLEISGLDGHADVSGTGDSGLTIVFKSAEYARMMGWLDQIRASAGLTVEYAKIAPAEEPDRVMAEIALVK